MTKNLLQKKTKGIHRLHYHFDIMLTLQQIQEKKDIIQLYNKIHEIIFHKLKVIPIITISIIILLLTIQDHATQSTTIDPVIQSKIVATFTKQKSTTSNIKDIHIVLKWWQIQNSGNLIVSDNNLLLYKGFVAPRFLSIYRTAPIVDIELINKWSYSIQDIDSIFQNIIFSPIQQNSIDSSQPNTIPVTNIATTFNINCINNIVLSPICEDYLQKFIQQSFMYNRLEAEDVESVHKTLIQNTKRQKKYCESIADHVLYSKTKNEQANKFIKDCPQDTEDKLIQENDFREVQEQLRTKNIENKVYQNNTINKYKLTSMWQSLYSDSTQNKITSRYLEQYIAYTQNLLRKNMLTGSYKEMLYYYNNTYLLPTLYDIQTQNPSISNTNAIENINILNKWSKLLWFTWLENNIQNKGIITHTNTLQTQSTNISIQALLQGISRFPYAQIKKQDITNDTVDISGTFKLTALLVENKTVEFSALLKQDGSRLYVTSITIKDQDVFNQALHDIIHTQTQGITFSAIYEFINNSIAVYLSPKTEITVCDQINQLIPINIIQCWSSLIEITKQNDPKWIYTISLSGQTITDIKHSDTATQQSLIKFIGTESDFIRLPATIAAILDTDKDKAPEENKIQQANIIRISDSLRQFLWTRLDDISYYKNVYFIQFEIDKINFIAQYDTQSHTIVDLYFKDVMMNKKPIAIKNINLTLSETNQTNINNFVADPLEYIKNTNLSAFTAYIQFSSKK